MENDDPELTEFLRDAKALRTSVEHKWTAWLSDRADGIVGTGSTEVEAIKALAAARKRHDDSIVQQPTDPG